MGRIAKSHEEFVKEIELINPDVLIIGKYKMSSERVQCKCRKCLYEWQPVAAELTRGKGCPKCAGTLRMTHDEFASRLSLISPSIMVIGTYRGSKEKVACECGNCGHRWSATANSLLNGHGCPECAKASQGGKRRKSHGQFVRELHDINPDIEVLGRYVNSSSPIRVRCLVCGHEWSPLARSLVNVGQGCPECARKRVASRRIKSHEQFVKDLSAVNPRIEVVGEYVRSNRKVACRCLRCGNEWSATPGNLLQGVGCPRCARTGTSFMEQFLLAYFKAVLGEDEVLSRDRTAVGRELDIFIPNRRFAIEIGSWYWHSNRLKSDREKEVLCNSQGIKLVTVYDCCPKPTMPGTPDGSLCYDTSLAEEEGHVTLMSLARELGEMAGIGDSCDVDWESVEDEATDRSVFRTTESFITGVASVSSDVEVIGKYRGTKERIKCRCRTCGKVWSPIAGQLLRGQGCPDCRKTAAALRVNAEKKFTTEEYEEALRIANPEVELLSPYVGSLDPVQVRCKVCGHVWSPRAEALTRGKRGSRCPICSNRARVKTNEQFLAELREVNPRIEVLGTYERSSIPIKCRCGVCGHEWSPRPAKLLMGQGCPKCAGRLKQKVVCVETGEEYVSFAAAGRALGLASGDTISQACKGKRETAAGCHWRLVQ